MAAPANTARTTPTGYPLTNGHSTKIAFSRLPGVNFWEKEVQPPGLEGGDPIDVTTMFNTTYTTFAPQALCTLTPVQVKAAYDPSVLSSILSSLLNQPGSVTIRFPDGSMHDFYGYLRSFIPDNNVNGQQPTATITVVPTNWDPTNRVEASAVVTSVSGT